MALKPEQGGLSPPSPLTLTTAKIRDKILIEKYKAYHENLKKNIKNKKKHKKIILKTIGFFHPWLL